jgi:cytoskeletal protein RodZ
VNSGGGSGWDEPPLDIQIPDDARELDRDVLAYRRELRAKRRRNRMRRLGGPFAGRGTVMPLLASILAVCLVAGAMLSVATFSPAPGPAEQTARPTTAVSTARPASPRSSAPATTPASTRAASRPSSTATRPASTSRASRSVSPSASSTRPSPSGSGSSGAPR